MTRLQNLSLLLTFHDSSHLIRSTFYLSHKDGTIKEHPIAQFGNCLLSSFLRDVFRDTAALQKTREQKKP